MYSTAEWDLDLSRGYWDRRPFFLAEGSTVQWTVTTDSAVPSAFYVFGSAAAYADYAAHRRTAPLVAAHVALGDALVRVGSCSVSSTADWDACIARIERAQQTGTVLQGFCVPGPHARAAGHLWNDSELDAMLRRLSFPFFFLFMRNGFMVCSSVFFLSLIHSLLTRNEIRETG